MRLTATAIFLASATAAWAAPSETFPQTILASHGEIYLNNAFERDVLYGDWHFAPARRVGDFVFLSGVVVRQGEPKTVEGFKAQLRRAFTAIQGRLAAAKLTFADVVELDTFHVFESPHFEGTKQEHFDAVRAVKDEFIKPPYPTWTAIGVESLVGDTGLVEIKVTAYAPRKSARGLRETKYAALTR